MLNCLNRYCLLLLLLSNWLWANDVQPHKWQVGGIITNFDYSEYYDDGQLANQENGRLTGVSLGYNYQDSRYFYQLGVDYLSGKVEYQGYW